MMISLPLTLIVFHLINRIASVALHMTGLSLDSAKFQARSALTGVGFTTKESELIVQHPVRRRIIMLLMLLGNSGIVAILASVVITLVKVDGAELWIRISVLVLAVILIAIIAHSKWVDRRLMRIIVWALEHFKELEIRDYASLMQLSEGYGVVEIKVQATHSWLGKKLFELDFKKEGILLLGIYRENGKYIGGPTAETLIKENDLLLLYGKTPLIKQQING